LRSSDADGTRGHQAHGDLATKYGYGDWGECLTVADTRRYGSLRSLCGAGRDWRGLGGPENPGRARGGLRNIPRIGQIDLKDADNFMASANVHSLAQDMGWYDPSGKEPFRFWKAYSANKPYSIREFFILSSFAPSLGLTMASDELPFTVKPEKKVSVKDLMAMYRQTYEGTEYDVTRNLMVPPSRRPGSAPQRLGHGHGKEPCRESLHGRDMIRLFNSTSPGP